VAAQLSGINIKLGTQTAELEKGFKKAQGTVGDFSATMEKLVKRVAQAALAMSAAVVGAAVLAVKKQLPVLDDIATIAERLGTSGQKLLELSYAAQQADASQESLIKGLQRFQKSIGEAAEGTGAAVDAFKNLGLSAEELSTMDPVDAFLLTADAIKDLSTQAEKFAVSSDLMGRTGGQDLINFMMKGGEATREMMMRFRELHGEISEADFAEISIADNAMRDLSTSVEGLARKFTVIVAPALTNFSEWMTKLLARLQGFDADTVKATTKVVAFAAAFGTALLVIPKIITAIKAITAALKTMNLMQVAAQALAGPGGWITLLGSSLVAVGAVFAADKAFDSLTKTTDATKARMSALAEEGKALEESLRTPMEKINADFAKLRQLMNANVISAETYRRAVAKLKDQLREASGLKEMEKAAEESKRKAEEAFKKMEDEAKSLADSLRTPFERMRDDIARLNELLDSGALKSMETYRRAIEKVTGEFAEAELAKTKFEEPESPSSIAAVTRASVAGFSAVIEARNESARRIDFERKVLLAEEKKLEVLERIETELRRGGVTIRKVAF
jgi:hypothetical protein